MSLLSTLIEIDQSISKTLIPWNANARIIRGIMDLGADNNLFKGVVPASVIWYLWGLPNDRIKRHLQLIATFITAAIAIAVGRILANFMPFRVRPIGIPEIAGPYVKQSDFIEQWSAMPSDHATMFFALASCILLISKSAGVFLLLHAAVIVCASRVLLGLHFFSDVVVGGLIGIAIALALMPNLVRVIMYLRARYDFSLISKFRYPLLFLVTFQFATMFDDVRRFAEKLVHFLF